MSGARRRSLLVVVLAICGVAVVQHVLVSPTNFGGADEWLLIDLSSRGVLGIPYAHRPLVLVFQVVAAWLWPHSLTSYWLLAGACFCMSGILTALLVRRLVPGEPLLMLLAGVFAVAWAPLDSLRLDTVLVCGYAGFTCSMMGALVAFRESWYRSRPAVLAIGGLLGFLSALGVESVLPVLGLAPVLLLGEARASRRRFVAWTLAWWAMLGVAAAVVAVPLVYGGSSYQRDALGVDLVPLHVGVRVLRLLGMQFTPLFKCPPGGFGSAAVTLSVFLFCGGLLAMGRVRREEESRSGLIYWVLGVGLALAVSAHLGLALTPRIVTAARTQVLSAPGFGIALAAAIIAVGRVLPRRMSVGWVALAGAWIVGSGTGRIAAMQAEWDAGRNAFPGQARSLAALTKEAPALKPGTLVILLDEEGSWPYSFTFRHALRHLYGDGVVGLVHGTVDEGFLYPQHFTSSGVVTVPWAVIRREWNVSPSLHTWETIVVVRLGGDGRVAITEEWPAEVLPPLPSGARYTPSERILDTVVRGRERRLLIAGTKTRT